MSAAKTKKRRAPRARWRVLCEVAVVGVFVFGLFFQTGTGSASAMGPFGVFYLCPIGALTSFLASKTFIPAQVFGLAIFAAFTLLFGRAFCAWICPTQLWYKVVNRLDNGQKRPRRKRARRGARAAAPAVGVAAASEAAGGVRPASVEAAPAADAARDAAAPARKTLGMRFLSVFGSRDPRLMGGMHDSRNWVLAGVLVAAFLVAFPMFCLICPVGLTFASLVSLFNFVRFDTFGPGVVVFPLLLLVEILVVPRWCHTLCPISAAISWVSRGNKTFVPAVDESVCLNTTGGHCPEHCKAACVERIDLHRLDEGAPLHQCTKCNLCADACPVSAITFPFLPQGRKASVPRVGASGAEPASKRHAGASDSGTAASSFPGGRRGA